MFCQWAVDCVSVVSHGEVLDPSFGYDVMSKAVALTQSTVCAAEHNSVDIDAV